MSFRKDDASDATAHPAQIVLDILGSQDEENRKLHCLQIQTWYQEYATSRGLPNLFKNPVAKAIDASMHDETIKIPLVCLRFDKPVDGLPVMEDWITTFESMFFAGIELNREPLDCTMSGNGGQYL
ncbi:unnamed protein product [Cladocopium goreaui]|uniref:Uncharacterized protein n=1 Tax=Cladocopium goreaui TaxID=2562237 RepID=A0A9P1BPQ2_9DINO|nr:unnamed protein product [Cladocopium goreaui]